ncbi:MAG: 3-dehydroquinate synthase [Saprospiraceae bacterium]|nr:3-dehydroquinate synthase [Saprospiraceae bacterium]
MPASEPEIFFGALADTLPGWLAQRQYSRLFVLTDANTQRHCRLLLPPLHESVEFVLGAHLPPGSPVEPLKTLPSCAAIWSAMLEARLDRRAVLLNLGGGVVGDMGGFCAAAYKRGIDFVQIPTTLLAMTDAAIGGKTGVDFQGIKNVLGLFQNPAAIFIDPAFLRSLPARELHSGFAEVLKHALIGHPALWATVQAWSAADLSGQPEPAWQTLLEASVSVKTQVVTADPHEAGLRALLNFGHTFGHAVESFFLETKQPLTHGEAVALGMLFEGLDDPRLPAFAAVIRRLFRLPVLPESIFDALWQRMLHDKKNASGAVRIAVPDAEPFSLKILELSREDAWRRFRACNQLNTSPSV